jgi:hypothetical protein
MFWQKKEEKHGLPDLPSAKAPPIILNTEDEEDEEEQSNALPAFPDSPSKKGFSQTAIKGAISPEDELPELPSLPEKNFKLVEEEEDWRPRAPFSDSIIESERFVPKNKNDKNDVFIRLDKYFSAKKALETAKLNLSEIEDLLKRIRETRLREEQELLAWEKDMLAIKAKIKEITENIFEKLE